MSEDPASRARRALLVAALAAAIAGRAAPAAAQIAPNAHWRTLPTAHFLVHFTPTEEDAARRAAVDAERAYAALAERLHPPRGPIDLVLTDNVDISNGFTTPFPTVRITVYARPPLDEPSLRNYDDWLMLVITHELTHAFHLDRARGWWGVAQHVLGRAPFLFPGMYEPGWLIEGMAVHYESEITGSGRDDGTYMPMLLRANVMQAGLLPFDRWNLATTRYPGGDMAYGFGSFFLGYTAGPHADSTLRRYVEDESGAVLPFFLNRRARDAFGISFSDAWRRWRDSLRAAEPAARLPVAGWRDLAHEGRTESYPRWSGDTALVFARDDWRAMPEAARIDTLGHETRLGRRNSLDANSPGAAGEIVFAQLDYTDAYHVRSDLYVQRGGSVTRLTHGARLIAPDVRGDGAIVAVRLGTATTQLVRVSARGDTITPLTGESPDTMWAEPRWSPHGSRIAATRWTRGGDADVVVLDTLGNVEHALTHDRAFDASPGWTPDGRAVLFSSDRTGVSDVYIAPADGSSAPRRISRAVTGLYYPALSPDGRTLAAVRYDDAGWHVGIAPFDTTGADSPPLDPRFAPLAMRPERRDEGPARGYSPWRTLLPHFWLPIAQQTSSGSWGLGAFTSGSDVIGRHAYYAQLIIDTHGDENRFDLNYQYAGLGQPVMLVDATQYWDRQVVLDTNRTVAGDLVRRTRTVSLGALLVRPRVRTNAFLELSGELELRRYNTDPAPLISRLADYYRSGPEYVNLVASAGWANAQHPVSAISYEDGVSFAATGRLRWLTGGGGIQSRSLSAVFDAYKSVNTGQFAHQVIAARLAGGIANGPDPGEYDIGGSNGTPVLVFPGLTLGGRHTFAVRGFPSGARTGTRVVTGSLEYRIPVAAPHKGFGFWPVFLDRVSVSLFGDAGTGWSPSMPYYDGKPIASVGGELDLASGLQYDAPYLLRLGLAIPVANNTPVSVPPASVYFQLGYAF